MAIRAKERPALIALRADAECEPPCGCAWSEAAMAHLAAMLRAVSVPAMAGTLSDAAGRAFIDAWNDAVELETAYKLARIRRNA